MVGGKREAGGAVLHGLQNIDDITRPDTGKKFLQDMVADKVVDADDDARGQKKNESLSFLEPENSRANQNSRNDEVLVVGDESHEQIEEVGLQMIVYPVECHDVEVGGNGSISLKSY